MSKNALVTGASRGIGAAIARRLAAGGFNVAVNCHTQASAETIGEAVAADCRAQGVDSACFVADVADFEESRKLIEAVTERFGSLDVLVNNAGIVDDALLVRMREEQFDNVVRVNLKSVYNTMYHAGRVMMRARKGQIVNIASIVGISGNPGQANYAAAKAGIIALTKTAAKELGPRGLRINAVAPGFIETAMTAALPEKVRQAAMNEIALRRPGRPEDVANAVHFLVSDQAAYITGQVLIVDGGTLF